MRRTVLVGWLIGVMATGAAAAQTPGRVCYRGQPRPACSTFFLTNAGAYATLLGASRYDTRLGAAGDWTVMFNVSARDAVGFGAFVNVNAQAPAFGGQLTYRRWLRAPASLDVAVGIPLVSDTRSGSWYGTIRWSPVRWFGLTARPEWLREGDYVCTLTTCTPTTRSHTRLSFGAEVGEVPGLVASLSGGFAVLAMLVLMAGLED